MEIVSGEIVFRNEISSESFIEKYETLLETNGLREFIRVDLTSETGSISLDRIESKCRNSGYAAKALRLLVDLSDEYHFEIVLIAHPLDDSTDVDRLQMWYENNGFIKVSANNNSMVRKTRSILEAG